MRMMMSAGGRNDETSGHFRILQKTRRRREQVVGGAVFKPDTRGAPVWLW